MIKKDMTLGQLFLAELEAEAPATRKCLERIPGTIFDWKPHPRSMQLGYLALIVAEVPLWISTMVHDSEIDFATFKHAQLKNGTELAAHFDQNMEGARKALAEVSDEALMENFYLKSKGQVLMTDQKASSISSTINHMVHHRGQLTVYMRLNEVLVPSTYGPSADDKTF